MSDSNSTDAPARNDAGTRLDLLLSAERDGVLEVAERAELDALLANDPAAVARRAAFASVDEALVDLGRMPLDDEAIVAGLEALRRRTGRDASTGVAGVVELGERRLPWRHPVVPLLAGAAAAALMLYFAVAPTDPVDSPAPAPAPLPQVVMSSDPVETSGVEADAPGLDPDLALALGMALGYGEGAELVPGVENDDLPVISELDLLDFMAAREEGGRG